eukprot:TRINITY_DN789_c0_g1_i4.p1 TRINITY_DN789_c0_g1~~TRINITY_DN789_c0_g1_i4.p1  ORF type:complete len:247 (+),score=32.44 TRINITY_DN789_c0_g1_i4:221-961(+)
MGAHVIMACRSQQRAHAATQELQQRYGHKLNLEFMHLDLSSLASVRDFAQIFKARHLPLHVLFNNAGIAMMPWGVTTDGYEQHWGVNYLGHFLLTYLLLDVISASNGRVLNTGSHRYWGASPEAVTEHKYSRHCAYAASKLAIVMFTQELCTRGITAFTVDPGTAATGIMRFLPPAIAIIARPMVALYQTAWEGAQASIHVASSPSVQAGKYYKNCKEEHIWDKATETNTCRDLWNSTVKDLGRFL